MVQKYQLLARACLGIWRALGSAMSANAAFNVVCLLWGAPGGGGIVGILLRVCGRLGTDEERIPVSPPA